VQIGHPLLRQVVTDRLAEAIVSGELRPGQQLSEVSLAEELGVSRSPIREALRQLENDGLVVSEPRKGTTVAVIDPEETVHFYDCRILLQCQATRLATARITEDELAELDQILGEMEDAAAGEEVPEYLDLVRRFHEAIGSACPNPVLVGLIRGIAWRAMRVRSVSIRAPGRMTESLDSHRTLVAALRSRDEQGAEDIVRRMLTASRDAILRSIAAGDHVA
jgi:DNA-binding GntR family transcriptional regulator